MCLLRETPTPIPYHDHMETAQAFIIVIGFLVKLAGFGIFIIGLVTTWNWVRKNVSFFTYNDEPADDSDDWVQRHYG